MPILGILDSAKTGNLVTGAWNSIATYSAGATSAITFSSIPSTYKYLRLVMRLRDVRTGAPYSGTVISFNGAPSGTSYGYTWVFGDSRTNNSAPFEDSTSGSSGIGMPTPGTSPYVSDGSVYGYAIIDIFDYQNTSKFTTALGSGGYVDNSSSYSIKNQVAFMVNGTWADTTTVNSITLTPNNPNFAGGVRAALYGIKG
jgi:hypothetical protein